MKFYILKKTNSAINITKESFLIKRFYFLLYHMVFRWQITYCEYLQNDCMYVVWESAKFLHLHGDTQFSGQLQIAFPFLTNLS